MSRYAIGGGREGKERLNILAQVMLPTTTQLLQRVGLGEGMRCLDVGCGGGDVTLLLATLVGPQGKVVGSDIDGEILALAQQDASARQLNHVEFRQADVALWQDEEAYDLVYARFLLTHLNQPLQCLRAMVRACRPGGALVVEDIDFSGNFCYPYCAAYERYTQLYQRVIERRGGDANIGPKLPGLLRQAGVRDVQINVVQPTHFEGDGKLMAAITLARIADALLAEGLATEDEIARLIDELDEAAADKQTLMSLPRVFQVWGRRA